MELLKKLSGHTLIYGASTVFGRLLNYLLTLVLYSWVLKPNELGLHTDIYSWTAFLIVAIPLGLEVTFFRFSNKNDWLNIYKFFNFLVLIVASLFILLVLFFNEKLTSILNYPLNSSYVKIISFIIFFDVLCIIPFAKLRFEEKTVVFSVLKLTNIIITIILNFLFLIIIPKYTENVLNWDKITAILYSNLFASFTIFLFFIKNLRFKIPSLKNIKKILKYSLPLLIISLLGMINDNYDKFMMDDLINDKSIGRIQQGIYGANYKLSIIMIIIFQAYKFAAEPLFFKSNNNKKDYNNYSFIMKYYVIISCIIFVSLTVFLDYIKLIISPEYHVGTHIVPILLLANIFLGINFNLSIFYKLTDKTFLGIFVYVVGAIITIVFNHSYVPKFGYVASSYITLASYFVMSIISFILMKRYFPIKYNLKNIFFHILLSLIIFTLSKNIELNGILNILFKLFLVIMYLFIVIKLEIKRLIKIYNSEN